MIKTGIIVFAAAVSTLLYAQNADFAVEKSKKVIKFGWDAPTPGFMEQNFEQIEKNMTAFDGMSIEFNSTTAKRNGRAAGSGAMFFDSWRWEKSDFQKEIESLKKVNARFRNLKHNFINTNSMAAVKDRFDWFDDRMWETITHNFALMAAIARETGCRGLNLDIENYERQTFLYNPNLGHTYAETWDKARQRGREFITAIAGAYPDIVLHTFFWLDQHYVNADGVVSPYDKSEKWIMGLSLAFINGIYDALPEGVTIVEGMESAGYRARSRADYESILATRWKKSRWLIDPKNYEKFLRRTQIGIATYLDRYIVTDPKSIWYISENPDRNLALLRECMTSACAAADEYVWVWGEKRAWYPWQFQGWMKKSAESVNRPGPLWEDALPGISQAILYAKAPQQYYKNVILSGKLGRNLLRNGNFAEAGESSAGDLPPDTAFLKTVRPWGCWQDSRSKGRFEVVRGLGRGGTPAVKISGVTSGCILQSPPFRPDGTYYIRARVKCEGKASASLSLGWTDAAGRWNFWGFNRAAAFSRELPDGWREAEILLTADMIPPEAKGISVQISVKSPGGAEDVCIADEIEFYNLNQIQ